MKDIDLSNFNSLELKLLEFFAKGLEENPEELKKQLISSPLNDRARVIAFCNKVPSLYNAINKLLN